MIFPRSHLQPLAALQPHFPNRIYRKKSKFSVVSSPENIVIFSCRNLQPLAAICFQKQLAASGCKWLLEASGCKWLLKWLQVAAGGKWLQVAAFWKIKIYVRCTLSANMYVSGGYSEKDLAANWVYPYRGLFKEEPSVPRGQAKEDASMSITESVTEAKAGNMGWREATFWLAEEFLKRKGLSKLVLL